MYSHIGAQTQMRKHAHLPAVTHTGIHSTRPHTHTHTSVYLMSDALRCLRHHLYVHLQLTPSHTHMRTQSLTHTGQTLTNTLTHTTNASVYLMSVALRCLQR